ncbi:ADP-ribosylation factor-like protein 16 [Tupaia chinensis]|uniref:ADP-ribosylation factor-like protein 16 n=2 Tax=Tupaia chinensis TaxID=246437 RepID=L9L0C4_TUPCH|nr:ADP-ribosylation factor-like protein 16 [Tupaia chinensis]
MMCLLLGPAGVGKTLLVKRLQNILPRRAGGCRTGKGELGEPPPTRPTVGAAGQVATRASPERRRTLCLRCPEPSRWSLVGVGADAEAGRRGVLESQCAASGSWGGTDSAHVLSAACFFSQVGTDLTDIGGPRKITIRELGGCMGPIWSSYYGNCRALLVGTDLTDIGGPRKITIRELGGCMGPIWSSYYGNCRALLFVMDASNPTQLSASCVQLLGLLSAEQLTGASVLILFNKIDLPCYMTLEEMKSLVRLPDIITCAQQNITTAEISAREGTGLAKVLHWLQDTHRASS